VIFLSSDVLLEVMTDIGKRSDTFCDLYLQRSTGHFATLEAGKLEELASGVIQGCGFRLLRGSETHFGHIHRTMTSAVMELISDIVEPLGLSPKLPSASQEELPITNDDEETPIIDVAILWELNKIVSQESKFIKKVTLKLSASQKEIAIFTSRGDLVHETRYLSRFAAQVIVESDGKLYSGYEASGYSVPLDRFLELEDIKSTALEAARKALLGPECALCPAGKMPVVLSGEAGGTMIHEACGHALEGDIVYKDFSSFKGKLGEQVASPEVTLVDDATVKDAFGSYRYDDEGTPSQRTVLIENGILKAYLADVFCNRMWGLPLTGNGRRQSYMNPPTVRMSNTFLSRGKGRAEEIISRVPYGLFAKKMGGGETDPTSGDFLFHVEEGYLIEDGKITTPVRGAVLVGNGPQALKDILAVGEDLKLEVGFCGKDGQSVPVTDGQPTVLIKELVVGGSDI